MLPHICLEKIEIFFTLALKFGTQNWKLEYKGLNGNSFIFF